MPGAAAVDRPAGGLPDLNALSLAELWRELCPAEPLRRLLELARDEDLGPGGTRGDVTSRSIPSLDRPVVARIVAREAGVAAGLPVVGAACEVLAGAGTIEVREAVADGDPIEPGTVLAELRGTHARVLEAERTVLNLLGRACAVATSARRFVDAVRGTGAVICETRKTTPGLRGLEKYAARCGGVHLHRVGLHDAALYKDNHLAGLSAGPLDETLRPVLETLRRDRPDLRFVEVEVDTHAQLDEVLRLDDALVDIVLLDNMPPATMAEAVGKRDAARPRWRLEASGGITLETVRAAADAGVDRISVGAITHSSGWLDLGLDV